MIRRNKRIFTFIFLCLAVFSAIEISTSFFRTKIFLLFAPDQSLTFYLNAYPDGYAIICADGSTPILLDVILFDSDNKPVPFSLINVKTNNFRGKIEPAFPVTNNKGRAIIKIYPDPVIFTNITDKTDNPYKIEISITLDARKSKTMVWNSIISPPPVLLVHGFQDSSESMIPLENFLEKKGLMVYTLDYPTETNIETMADALDIALKNMKSDLKNKGIYMGQADIVAHSLGGLVTRYYSTDERYLSKQNLRKIVFINVPHHGTPWAEAGAAVLDAPFLEGLYPTAKLFTKTFPSSINKGLNHNIQTANIALENDEVVPLPSSMLDSWKIGTKIYRIGSEPLNFSSIIANQATGSSFHRQILFYMPVFDDILHFLLNNLPLPLKRK